MKKIILLFIVIFSLININAQENKPIIGKWRTVSVRTNDVFLSKETDSVWVSDKFKNNYKIAIGQQNEIAHVRMNYSHNVFFFGKNNDYEYFLTENEKAVAIQKGTYKIENENYISLDITNRAGSNLKQKQEYYFENGRLLLKVNSVNYVLEKIEDK